MKNQIRQGEVLLVRCGAPIDYKATETTQAKLAIGETGNAHLLDAPTVEWLHDAIEDINAINKDGVTAAQNQMYVRITGDGVITHTDRKDGHNEAAVPAGTYLVVIKREYSPFSQNVGDVWD